MEGCWAWRIMNDLRSVVVTAFAVLGLITGHQGSARISTKVEEYAVYSALAARMSASDQIKLVVIKEDTVGYYVDPQLLSNEGLRKLLAPLTQETLDDHLIKNKDVHKLTRDLDIK